MFLAAAGAVAAQADASTPGASLLPRVADLRGTSAVVAAAVARAAQRDGVATVEVDDVEAAVRAAMWHWDYYPVRAV
jgi:malate dehydrogenase (oxaloacetate-decarboxylating)